MISAPLYRRSEDVGIEAVVIAELKLRDVERQIFGAYLMIAAHDTALYQRPETFDRIGVNSTNDALTGFMIDHAMRIFFAEIAVSAVVIRAEQAHFLGNCFAYEFRDCCFVDAKDNARNDVALTLHGVNDRGFERNYAELR